MHPQSLSPPMVYKNGVRVGSPDHTGVAEVRDTVRSISSSFDMRQYRDLRARLVHGGVRRNRLCDLPGRGAAAHAFYQARQPGRSPQSAGVVIGDSPCHSSARRPGWQGLSQYAGLWGRSFPAGTWGLSLTAGRKGTSPTAGRRKSVPCDWSFKNVPND